MTDQLHRVSFALHEELARDLGIQSYRKIPVLGVTPGTRRPRTVDICPWLDGDGVQDSNYLDKHGAAQVAPQELCEKLVEAAVGMGAELRIGKVEGVQFEDCGDGRRRVTGVHVAGEVLQCDVFAVCMGPWAVAAEQWFGVPIPMTGIKSTSMVFHADGQVEPFALFVEEDDRYGTHLEVYPRASGEIYVCGLGGSEYVEGRRLVDRELPPGQVHADADRVEAATQAFTALTKHFGSTPATTQACMRPCAPDALPIMGPIPGVDGGYIATAMNCWGICWAPVSGKSMAELILDGEAKCVDLTPFSLTRFMDTARGGRGRKRRTQSVGEQW